MSYEICEKKITDLKPHPKNPRRHPEKLISKLIMSITEYGFTSPVLVDGDNRILAGHARVKAAEKMGLEVVPTIVLPLTGAKADAYVVVDNKLSELSEWDEILLADLISDIDASGFDLELTGFDLDEIDNLFALKGCVEDEFDEEKAKKEIDENGGAITKTGDVWLLGEHKLLCGDSTNAEDFSRLLDGKKAQLCVTSPPCNNVETWIDNFKSVVKNVAKSADIAIFNIADKPIAGTQFVEPLNAYAVQTLSESGFRPIWFRILNKKSRVNAKLQSTTNRPTQSVENVTAFAKTDTLEEINDGEIAWLSAFGQHNYKFTKRLTKDERRSWGCAVAWDFADNEGKIPVELPWRCIKMHSNKSDVVLEPFCGSGTTIIACEQLNRACFAIEKDPTYCDIAVKRWEDFTNEKAILQ
jgi:hypothetical protein